MLPSPQLFRVLPRLFIGLLCQNLAAPPPASSPTTSAKQDRSSFFFGAFFFFGVLLADRAVRLLPHRFRPPKACICVPAESFYA
jgi:hypothetical protein